MTSLLLRCVVWLSLSCGLTASHLRADQPPGEKVLFSFLGNYCLECHDSILEKGERDFELFEFPLENVEDLIVAKEIVDQVTLKEMPPKKADQPTDEERLAVVRAIRESIAAARNKLESTGARTVIRRLSSREYEITLEVLFGRQVETLGLTADFPKEKTSRHIDTIGESLVTSGFLLDQYFQSAHRLIESRLGKPKMKPKSWHFTDNFKQYEELTGSHKSAFNFEYLCLYEQPNTDTRQGGYGHIEDFLEGVPVSGLYDIKVNAKAMHRFTHYDPKIFRIDLSEKFILGVVPGDATKGHIHYPQWIEPLLAKSIVPDEKFEWINFRVWLDVGQTPRFIFPNGPYESRASVVTINKQYADEFTGTKSKSGVGRAHILKQGELPHIRIAEIKVHGPIAEEAGGKEEVAIFGPSGFNPDQSLQQLYAFGERAYRRPLADADRKSIKKTYDLRLSEKATPRAAALDTLKMILCSPSFLYLSEITDEKKPMLGKYDLVSRLSYALWASPPDDTLLAAAASKEAPLTDPKHLRVQSERLLSDERVEGFVNGFLDSWLNLRDIGQMPPPRAAARSYYAENLPESMKQETRLFFHHLMSGNRPVTDFLDADYTFVDKKLAALYQLPQKDSLRLEDGFRRVNIKSNYQRGGLLGMASVLTASANGVETSPVTRGVWVSENILGVTPPPPPDVVPAIDSDVRGATTIRERLEKHRSQKTCAECHRKIDHLGFGLESFDPIGRWRANYPKPKGDAPAPKIDTSGEFSSGEKFADFKQFKKQILETRKDAFTRHLISEFLTYATGRHMEAVDQFQIDDILATVQKEKYGLRSLILESLSSKIFRSR
ncbi:MAG: DUF1592 domain-containing protein [Verrucomicrobiales bacterium]